MMLSFLRNPKYPPELYRAAVNATFGTLLVVNVMADPELLIVDTVELQWYSRRVDEGSFSL
jgi:hypothetical protein